MNQWLGLALALGLWLVWQAPALAESGSRYSAPLWAWIVAIAVAAGLSVVGMAYGLWFLRKRSRLDSSE